MTRQSIRLTQGETKCCLLVMLACLVAVADNRSTYISQDKITNNRPAYIYLFIVVLALAGAVCLALASHVKLKLI